MRPHGVVSSMLALTALVLISVLVAGCEETPTGPTHYAGFSQVDLRYGTGAEATTNSLVTVNYWGWLYHSTNPEHKGALFDSSIGAVPFSFTLGAGQVIAGWDQGLIGMRVGGLRRLVIPPSLGYGSARVSSIPPNATLLFEVELLDVQ